MDDLKRAVAWVDMSGTRASLLAVHKAAREILAANSIPEGAPVGTIARRPDGAFVAVRVLAEDLEQYWTYTCVDHSGPDDDWPDRHDADSWPVIYDPREDGAPRLAKAASKPRVFESADEAGDTPETAKLLREIRDRYEAGEGPHPLSRWANGDEYHEGDKPRLERLMREPSVFEAHLTKLEVIEVLDALSRLDGTVKSAVKLLTGFSDERLEELGGLSDPTAQQEPGESLARGLDDISAGRVSRRDDYLDQQEPVGGWKTADDLSAMHFDAHRAAVAAQHGTVNMDGSLPTTTAEENWEKIQRRWGERRPQPYREPRVVDRLGVDEQGSRWQDRQLGEWKFNGQAWRYLELTWTSVPGGEWVEAEPSKRYGPYVEVLS